MNIGNSKQKLIKFYQAFALLIENISMQNKNEIVQFRVTHATTSIFNILFSNLFLHLLALFLVEHYASYKNKFKSSLLQNLVMVYLKSFQC